MAVVISSGEWEVKWIIPLGRALQQGRGIGVQSQKQSEDSERRRNLMKTGGRTGNDLLGTLMDLTEGLSRSGQY